jgi:hypothetical protein
MAYATIAAGVGPSVLFNGADTRLRIGPLGLAGLLLVLAVIVLLLKKLDPSQERILKLFLNVGGFRIVSHLKSSLSAAGLVLIQVKVGHPVMCFELFAAFKEQRNAVCSLFEPTRPPGIIPRRPFS